MQLQPLALNIKLIRKQLGLSVEEFAIDMDVNAATQKCFERGTKQPDASYVKQLARAVSLRPAQVNNPDLCLLTLAPKLLTVPSNVHSGNSEEVERLRNENSLLKKKITQQQRTIAVLRLEQKGKSKQL